MSSWCGDRRGLAGRLDALLALVPAMPFGAGVDQVIPPGAKLGYVAAVFTIVFVFILAYFLHLLRRARDLRREAEALHHQLEEHQRSRTTPAP